MKKYNHFAFVLFLFSILTFLIFWKTFLTGLYPFPGNFMVAWYEPWKSDNLQNGLITIPHKPIADDVFRQLYPFKVLAMDLVKRFEMPLWNPYNGAGMPLLATLHVGFLNPFNIFFLFLPSYLAWSLQIIILPIVTGICLYLFCRKIHMSFFAAIFSSISFVLSGFVIARMIFGEYIVALPALPLLLYFAECGMEEKFSKKALLLPLTICILILSGHPQTTFYIFCCVIAYFIFHYRYLRSQSNIKKRISFCFVLLVLGIGLSSIQIIPTIELFLHANVNNSSSSFIFQRFLLSFDQLITILIPNYFGNQATYNYWGGKDYIETLAFVGLIPSFFAYLALFRKNVLEKKKYFFFFVIVISILSTLDWFGSRFLFSLSIPILSTSVPSRVFFLTTFSICILGGIGFDKWVHEKNSLKIWFVQSSIFFLLIGVIFFVTFFSYLFHQSCDNEFIINCRLISLRNTILESLIFLSGWIIFWIRLLRPKKRLAILSISILVITTGIGLYNAYKFLPFSPRNTFFPKNNLITVIQKQTTPDRVFGLRSANIKTDYASSFRFYDPNYYDTLYNKRYGELINFANKGTINNPLPRSDVEINNDIKLDKEAEIRRQRLLNILSIKTLVYKKNEIKNIEIKEKVVWEDNIWQIRENPTSLPKAYLVDNFELISEKTRLLNRLFDPSFNITQSVILEQNPAFKDSSKNDIIQPSLVKIINYKENTVSLDATSNSNKILVVTDNYYPGWKAFVDYKETNIFRANYTFRAIIIPEGKHTIMFSYEPTSLKIGIIISSISALIYFLLVLRYWRKPIN